MTSEGMPRTSASIATVEFTVTTARARRAAAARSGGAGGQRRARWRSGDAVGVHLGRLGRMRLDRELHVRACRAVAVDQRRQKAPRLALLGGEEHERPRRRRRRARDALASRPSVTADAADEIVQPGAAGDREASPAESARLARCARRVFVEQRASRPAAGKPRSAAVAGVGGHLVGLVQVVQPVAVDEPVLQARPAGCRGGGTRGRAPGPIRRPPRR